MLFDSRLHLKLGFSSVAQFAEVRFRISRSRTFETLRVARALPELPLSRERFLAGDLTWSDLREITRIASTESEKTWVDFTLAHSFKALKAEVTEAVRKGRPVPRKDGYGLPALDIDVRFRLSPEEHDALEKALEKASGELRESLGKEAEPKDALLYLAMRMVETDPAGTPAGRTERKEPAATILYHLCPECRKAHLITGEGPVEVPAERIEAVETCARKVEIAPEEEIHMEMVSDEEAKREIDRPNTPALVMKVKLRDGNCCANPFCRRRLGLHAHHIRFRSRGGRTAIWNEASCCARCHAIYAQSDVMTSNLTYPLEVASSPPRLTLHNILPGCPVGSAATRAGRGTGDRADEALGPGMWTSTAVRDWEVHFAGNYAQLFSAETFAGKEFGKRLGITSDCA